MSNSINKNLPMLIELHCSSKAQKKKIETFTIKAICECTINIIDRNIKVSDQEKRKINRDCDKIENSWIRKHHKRRGKIF